LTEPITVERDGHVLLVGVNRPAKRNAFNLATIEHARSATRAAGRLRSRWSTSSIAGSHWVPSWLRNTARL
jgi:hypothetical protein